MSRRKVPENKRGDDEAGAARSHVWAMDTAPHAEGGQLAIRSGAGPAGPVIVRVINSTASQGNIPSAPVFEPVTGVYRQSRSTLDSRIVCCELHKSNG